MRTPLISLALLSVCLPGQTVQVPSPKQGRPGEILPLIRFRPRTEPYKPSDEEKQRIQAKIDELGAKIRDLRARRVDDSLLADVEIFQEAARWILTFPEPKKSGRPRAWKREMVTIVQHEHRKEVVPAYHLGEVEIAGSRPEETATSIDTFAGKIHVKWAPEAAVSSLGQMPYFIEFLKTSGRFDQWVEDCPLYYTSGNAPEKRNILGTLLLSVLAGHWRYAHINAIRGDGINPELLGMTRVASEDSVRRGMKSMDEAASGGWMKQHLKASYEPLLQEPWILDVDSTVKPMYGHQQDAKVGYNPSNPGRPSHAYHSYFVANIRMVLDMEVQAGNQTAPLFAQPGLWSFLDGLTERDRPIFLRGDSHWGAEKAMVGAEERKIGFLFKLKQSVNVKRLIGQIFTKEEWEEAGQQWQGRKEVLRLEGWSQERQVVVLRRPLRSKPAAEAVAAGKKKRGRKPAKQLTLDLPELTECW